MGMRRISPSWRRISVVNVKPSISGISQSVSTRSNGSRAKHSNASLPFPVTSTRQPSAVSIPLATCWLTELSSTSSTRAGIADPRMAWLPVSLAGRAGRATGAAPKSPRRLVHAVAKVSMR